MNKLRLAYLGSPDFSARFLNRLLADLEIPLKVVLVATQPDKKIAKKQILTPTPIKALAQKHDILYLTLNSKLNYSFSTLNSKLEKLNVDLALVYAFGAIIPKQTLGIPRYGFWNVHPSLLPKYRGASPVAGALIAGEVETGVTLIKMDEQMDHGPIIAQEKLEILPKERRPELTIRLTDLAYRVFKRLMPKFLDSVGALPLRGSQVARNLTSSLIDQDHSKATYTKLLKKENGFIPILNLKFKISNSPKELFNLFRGLYPWPGIWTLLRLKTPGGQAVEKRLKITDMNLVDGKLIVKKVQLEGKKEVDFKTFTAAYGKVF